MLFPQFVDSSGEVSATYPTLFQISFAFQNPYILRPHILLSPHFSFTIRFRRTHRGVWEILEREREQPKLIFARFSDLRRFSLNLRRLFTPSKLRSVLCFSPFRLLDSILFWCECVVDVCSEFWNALWGETYDLFRIIRFCCKKNRSLLLDSSDVNTVSWFDTVRFSFVCIRSVLFRVQLCCLFCTGVGPSCFTA